MAHQYERLTPEPAIEFWIEPQSIEIDAALLTIAKEFGLESFKFTGRELIFRFEGSGFSIRADRFKEYLRFNKISPEEYYS